LVEKNINYFVKQKNMQVGVRATLSASMVERQSELIEYFHNIGIKFLNVHPACVSIEDDQNANFQWDPIVFAKNFLIAHQAAKKLGMFYNTLYITGFDETTRHFCRSTAIYPHLTTDGYVSCCDFAQFGSSNYTNEKLQQLVYGKYIPEKDVIIYDEDKISKIRARCSENLIHGECKDCKFIYHCAGGCIGQTVNETGNLMGRHKKNCEITKYLAERMPLNAGLHPVIHS
jgi:radical SAM protein with 4Fe4S-binding SPASM domain